MHACYTHRYHIPQKTVELLDSKGQYIHNDSRIIRFLSKGNNWAKVRARISSLPIYVHTTDWDCKVVITVSSANVTFLQRLISNSIETFKGHTPEDILVQKDSRVGEVISADSGLSLSAAGLESEDCVFAYSKKKMTKYVVNAMGAKMTVSLSEASTILDLKTVVAKLMGWNKRDKEDDAKGASTPAAAEKDGGGEEDLFAAYMDEYETDEEQQEGNVAEEDEEGVSSDLLNQLLVVTHTHYTKQAAAGTPLLDTWVLDKSEEEKRNNNFDFQKWLTTSLGEKEQKLFAEDFLLGETPTFNDMKIISKEDLSPIKSMLSKLRIWKAIETLQNPAPPKITRIVESNRKDGGGGGGAGGGGEEQESEKSSKASHHFLSSVFGRGKSSIPLEGYRDTSFLVNECLEDRELIVIWNKKYQFDLVDGGSVVKSISLQGTTKASTLYETANSLKPDSPNNVVLVAKDNRIIDPWGLVGDYSFDKSSQNAEHFTISLIELDAPPSTNRVGHPWHSLETTADGIPYLNFERETNTISTPEPDTNPTRVKLSLVNMDDAVSKNYVVNLTGSVNGTRLMECLGLVHDPKKLEFYPLMSDKKGNLRPRTRNGYDWEKNGSILGWLQKSHKGELPLRSDCINY
uniref:Uncharacterized protein n=1 Tax=Lotharella globosa TaxID=91324 RepID=A0A7S4DS18_9EUKA